jgi:ComF family protein
MDDDASGTEHVTQSAVQSPNARLAASARRALSTVADFLVPAQCLACHTAVDAQNMLCGGCWRQMHFIRAPLCDRLGIPLPGGVAATGRIVSSAALADPPDYDRARAVAHFTGTLRPLVHRLKYSDRQETRALFGTWLTEAGRELTANADVLIPVPLNRMRLLWRRFNQSALLAHEVSRQTGVPVDAMALIKRKPTPPQVGLTQAQRYDNVAGAFAVTQAGRDRIQGRHVVLIDDVITTGATVSACARVLRRAGAAHVDVLALGLVTDFARATPREVPLTQSSSAT